MEQQPTLEELAALIDERLRSGIRLNLIRRESEGEAPTWNGVVEAVGEGYTAALRDVRAAILGDTRALESPTSCTATFLVSPSSPREDSAEGRRENLRELPRGYLNFALTVCDISDPKSMGIVRDISEKGVGVLDIEANVNDVKILEIQPDPLLGVGPITFEARCRWTKRAGPEGRSVSGFEVTNASEISIQALQQFVQSLWRCT